MYEPITICLLVTLRDSGESYWLERGITSESFAANVDRQRLEALSRLVDSGKLRPQLGAVLPVEEAREALARVAGSHTRGEIVLQIGP